MLLFEARGVRRARFVSRRTRFTVELEAGSARLSCHLHDPGRLLHLLRPGAPVYYRGVWRPGRKTSCDVVAVEAPEGVLVLEDTRLANAMLPGALARLAPGLRVEARERMVNGMRVDFVAVSRYGRLVLVEVKSTNLVEDGAALFPDAPSARARRQLEALAAASSAGAAGLVVFTVLRPDAERLRPHRRVDPLFSRLLCGLRLRLGYLAYRVRPVVEGSVLRVYLDSAIPVEPC